MDQLKRELSAPRVMVSESIKDLFKVRSVGRAMQKTHIMINNNHLRLILKMSFYFQYIAENKDNDPLLKKRPDGAHGKCQII